MVIFNSLRRHAWLLLTLLLIAGRAQAQSPVSANPVFFTDNTPVTITYNASLGNRALLNFTGNVYIWTGVVTASATSNTWSFVKSPSFNQPDPAALMTRSATNPNIYTITFTPRTYYNVPAGTPIFKLAMIFKNADGSTVGRNADGSDMYIDVTQNAAQLQVALTSPASGTNPTVVAAGSSVSVTGTASTAATFTLTLNGTQVASQTTAGTSFSANVPITQGGLNTLVLTASAGGNTASATATVLVPPTVPVAALPGGANPDGPTYLNGGRSVILSFTAPRKAFVYVLGDFNNWQPTNAALMSRTTASSPAGLSDVAGSAADAVSGRWWVQVDGLTPGTDYSYQFLVYNQDSPGQFSALRVADPYTEKVLDPNNDRFIPEVTFPAAQRQYPTGRTTGLVSVLQPGQTPYTFQVTNFQRPARTNLVIYELHLRDFIARHDYQTLTDTLTYLSRLGVNAIELMPINEFDGNDSWGYNPCFYFALDKYYGTKDAFKRFVDECHRRGMAVILDIVLNQSTGQSPMVQLYGNISTGPAADNIWFNVTAPHPFSVYNDLNHESPYTRYFSKKVMQFWLQEYKVDGYRFDLSKGFTQRQTGNDVGAWSAYDQSRINIWQDYYNTLVATDPGMYPMLEHLGANDEETELSRRGFMLWGNMSYNYQQATMGYQQGFDLSWGYWANRGWASPNLITYMESHDEERLQYKNMMFGNSNGSYNVRDIPTGLARNGLGAAVFFTQPGPRLMWQFGELGYDFSINYCSNGTISNDCRTSAKPIRWDYYQNADRRRLYDVYRSLIALKKLPDFVAATNYQSNLGGFLKSSSLTGSSLSVVTVGNFDVVQQSGTVNFPSTGTWFNYLTGQTLAVTQNNTQLTLAPGQYAVYTNRRINLPAGVVLSERAPTQTTVFGLSLAPNPAQQTTTIRYQLPTAATASIAVQNVLGQTVRQLAPQRQGAGAQAQTLSLQDLAPGVYLVRLQAGDLTQTSRLLVE